MNNIYPIIDASHRAVARVKGGLTPDEACASFMKEIEHVFTAPELDVNNLMGVE